MSGAAVLQISTFDEKTEVAEMKSIIEIMKLVGRPRSHLLALLEIICESFPTMETWLGGFEFVKVTCFDLHHGVHNVSAVGFVLLKLAEGALGSSKGFSLSPCLQRHRCLGISSQVQDEASRGEGR